MKNISYILPTLKICFCVPLIFFPDYLSDRYTEYSKMCEECKCNSSLCLRLRSYSRHLILSINYDYTLEEHTNTQHWRSIAAGQGFAVHNIKYLICALLEHLTEANEVSYGAGIRTPIVWAKTRSPAIRRPRIISFNTSSVLYPMRPAIYYPTTFPLLYEAISVRRILDYFFF